MTKREAVKGLDRLKTIIREESNMQIALDMAIQALEQEQQRQEDIYECQYCFGEVHKNYTYCPFCGERIAALEQEPTCAEKEQVDLISRQAAIDAIGKAMPQLTTPDGCGEFDHEIQIAAEAFSDCMKIINDLPSAQPDVPDTNVGDIISRQAVIEALHTRFRDGFDGDKWWNSTHVLAAIEGLSTAQPFTEEQIQTMQELESAQVEKAYELGKADRPTGHWIETAQAYYEMINEKGGGVDENTPYFTDDIACSECLAKFSVIDNETERFDFCPNCGCSMKGADDE